MTVRELVKKLDDLMASDPSVAGRLVQFDGVEVLHDVVYVRPRQIAPCPSSRRIVNVVLLSDCEEDA